MLDQGNRTFIGSVVFVDIIGYSRKSVSEQIQIKDRFTNLLSEALADISPEQRLILDTGDGAALSFLGDPEDALFVSMNLRDLINRAAAAAAAPAEAGVDALPVELPLRIGINLGPVKLARDINGHPNIVGDGINVAQRIMSFAQVGQIVVSRSFFDVVSVISEEYAKLFRYEGSRTDKHVREHEIYVVGESESAFNKAKAGSVDRAAATGPNSPGVRASATGTHGAGSPPLPFFQDQRKLMLAGGGLGVVVLALVAALVSKKPADGPIVPAVAKMESAPVTAKPELPNLTPAPAAAPPAATVTTATVASTDKPAETTNPAAATSLPSSGGTAPPTGATPVTDAKSGKPEPTKADAAKQPLTLGTVMLSIDPWGEVFINGKSIGTSPPVKQHKLAPGKYKIEVRNTSFTPFVANVEVKAKEDLRIKHKFQ